MKFVMTQAVCPEGMQLLDGIADVYVADNQDPGGHHTGSQQQKCC